MPIFREKKSRPQATRSGQAAQVLQQEFERALDTIAHLLRTYGVHAFDLDTADAGSIRQRCETWAQQLLVGPGAQAMPAAPADAGLKRDFGGARAFLAEQRRKESDYVKRSLSDLRQVVWFFIHGVSRTFSGDQVAGQALSAQMRRLKDAVDGNSTQDLKREAMAVVDHLTRYLEDRRQQQRRHLKELGTQLQPLRGELISFGGGEAPGTLDPLTRLYDRKAFDEQIVRVADLDGLLAHPSCLLMVAGADACGAEGEEALRQVARCLLRQFFRRDELVARHADERFAVLSADPTLPEVLRGAQRLREAVAVSIGIAQHLPGEPPQAWVDRAVRALARARGRGGEGLVVDETAGWGG